MKKYTPFLLALMLVGCGRLPGSLNGKPGAMGARLAIPPAPVLFVPIPSHAQMPAPAAASYADDLAKALVSYDVPSVAGTSKHRNWQLLIEAARQGDQMIPAYHIIGPNGEVYGKLMGAPVPAQGWEQGNAALLMQTATRDSARLSSLLTQINAHVQLSSPESLVNRTPRVFVGKVTGALGDGDHSLPRDLGRNLGTSSLDVVSNAKDADFTIVGRVETSPAGPGEDVVQLTWSVRDSNGRLVGRVTQLHELKPSDMSPYWGDVAQAATQQAAAGISNVIQNDIVKKPKEPIKKQ